jgi:hypothetical protein
MGVATPPHGQSLLTRFESMKKILLERVRLLNLEGEPVKLTGCFQAYLLLIFLRHLA